MDSPSLPFFLPKTTSDGISPVTDLTNNLSTLSTEITPCRRISWSNPFPSDKKSRPLFDHDSSFEVNSPSVDEGILRDREVNINSSGNVKKRPLRLSGPRKFLFCNYDKENVDEENISKSSPIKPLSSTRQDSQSDLSGASQESGYVSSKYSEASFFSHASMPSVRSTVFTDDELDEDDAFFPIDKYVEEEDGESEQSHSVTQLLTKPLADSFSASKHLDDIENDETALRKGRPLQKAHSLEMCSSNAEESEDKFNENVKMAFKRPEPIDELTPCQSKRRKSSPTVASTVQDPANFARLHRCYSESAAIMRAVQKSDQEPNLIGDCSRPFSLPLISGRHQDLKSISCDTLAKLLKGEYNQTVKSFTIIDCRYPYEYEGGHIVGARNIYTQETLYNAFLSTAELPENESDQQNLTIFHCEFSSERAPKLLRYLRSKDRSLNQQVYPRLHHPEIYLLEGGYRAFFESFKDLCYPQSYKPMLHKDHLNELREFRCRSKSSSQDTSTRPKLRSNLKF